METNKLTKGARLIDIKYTAELTAHMETYVRVGKDKKVTANTKATIINSECQKNDNAIIRDGTIILGGLDRLATMMVPIEEGEFKKDLMEKIKVLYQYVNANIASQLIGIDRNEMESSCLKDILESGN